MFINFINRKFYNKIKLFSNILSFKNTKKSSPMLTDVKQTITLFWQTRRLNISNDGACVWTNPERFHPDPKIKNFTFKSYDFLIVPYKYLQPIFLPYSNLDLAKWIFSLTTSTSVILILSCLAHIILPAALIIHITSSVLLYILH